MIGIHQAAAAVVVAALVFLRRRYAKRLCINYANYQQSSYLLWTYKREIGAICTKQTTYSIIHDNCYEKRLH